MIVNVIALVFGILTAAAVAAGLATPNLQTGTWVPPSSPAQSLTYGVFKSCVNGVCTDNPFFSGTDIKVGNCVVNAQERIAHEFSMLMLLIIGGLLALLTGGFSIIAGRTMGIVRIPVSVMCLLCIAGGTVLTYFTIESFLYCKKNACAAAADAGYTNCSFNFDYSFWLLVGACGGAVLLFFLTLINFGLSRDETAPPSSSEPTAEPVPAKETAKREQAPSGVAQPEQNKAAAERMPTATAPEPSNDASRAADPPRNSAPTDQAGAAKAAPELPAGDWVYDAESGLYWSEEAYLFLHLDSGQFFDPNTGMWYDAATEEWYAPE